WFVLWREISANTGLCVLVIAGRCAHALSKFAPDTNLGGIEHEENSFCGCSSYDGLGISSCGAMSPSCADGHPRRPTCLQRLGRSRHAGALSPPTTQLIRHEVAVRYRSRDRDATSRALYRAEQLNAVFFTHMHTDHTEGFADFVTLRWMFFGTGPKIDAVCSSDTVSALGFTISCRKF